MSYGPAAIVVVLAANGRPRRRGGVINGEHLDASGSESALGVLTGFWFL
ncbi:MAG: hypothetical protein M3Y77_00230 [Actinomycetota bacterium]|nr:hypothetical protein [Actinomycetota bacterium]